MQYDIDLKAITLDTYRTVLKRQTLLPSRRMLKDGIEDTFARIAAQGVSTVAQLLAVLSTPAKLAAFAEKSGVDQAYLTLLRREVGTLKQKTVSLSAFPDTDGKEIEALAKQGIITSKDLYECSAPGNRLYALCELVRINGVGPNAAAMFYAAGYRSVQAIADADATTLCRRIAAADPARRYYAGALGEKDMQFCIDFAKLLLQFSR